MTGTVRPAGAQDIPALKNIITATGLFPADMLDEMISGFLAGASQDIWHVVEREGLVIGFGFCEPERMTNGTWNLLALAVHPDHQGSGAGAQLVQAMEGYLAQADQRILLIDTLGTADFAGVRDFYRKLGYTEEARIRDFYEAGGDKVTFWKSLQGAAAGAE